MLSFSYTILPNAKRELDNIDGNRNKILLELISPKAESRLRFEALAHQTSSALFLAGKSITPAEIISALEKEKKSEKLKSVYSYINAKRYIRHNWFLEERPIKEDDIIAVFNFFPDFKLKNRHEIKEIIDFVNITPDHGIVQSALAFALISRILPNDNNNINLSTLIAEMFLAKYGYDFRGILNLSKYWTSDYRTLKKIIDEDVKNKNLSRFIEYFIYAVSLRSEKALSKVKKEMGSQIGRLPFFELTKRQKMILALFDVPGAKITNREVQKEFKISQITASRDLSKLASLGYIFAAGRGRSVFYTKV